MGWGLRLVAASWLWWMPTVGQAMEVVASIKPLHSLVAAVMGDAGAPQLLLQGNVSEHTYALRPSDARLLAKAEVIFWGGRDLEGFLVRPLDNLAPKAVKVALLAASGVTLLPLRSGGGWEEEDHGHDHGHDHDHERQAGNENRRPMDPHAWLDPRHAMAMIQAIAATLAQVDPTRAGQYQQNASAWTRRLEQLDQQLATELAPVRKQPYIVFHDAYQYFEQRYGLNAVGSVMVNPERPPGARRVQEIIGRIAQTGAVCLFTEPQYSPRLAETVTANHPVRMGVLDPLGAALPEGPELYFGLLRGLSQALAGCLRQG
ncbi:MAG: zinc ABC transporter substrate-binding protein [Magnetococcales bacterium]|nr:zinc ABC transporter substrate-binding protein [Magnetococcales bacterium]